MTGIIADARREIDALERLRTSFGDITANASPDRRHTLVQLRRSLATQVTEVSAACNAVFASGAADHLVSDYRNLFSQMRAALALHQANWPAVRIDDDPAAYCASAMTARTAESEFVSWMKQVLDALEGRGVLPQPH